MRIRGNESHFYIFKFLTNIKKILINILGFKVFII